VDDEPDLLKLVVWMLKAMLPGASIRTATDGRRAAAKLSEFRPDLLVTDLRLPGMTGNELCRLVRERRELARTRILAMTAYDDPKTSREALESGADVYLAKPFSAEELRRAAARLLGAEPAPRRWRPAWPGEARGR
jgi:DNA-binding response OmpR family regulator